MSTSELESAILIKVPEAEHLVRPFRETLDPSESWGVPAHVTLLYPFLPPAQINDKVLMQLKNLIGSHPTFEVQFSNTKWFGESVLWLSPKPVSPFRQLMGALFSEFKDLVPYGDANLKPTPHLTVADRADLKLMHEADLLITPKLPISAAIGSVSVMTGSQTYASWTTLAELPLRADS